MAPKRRKTCAPNEITMGGIKQNGNKFENWSEVMIAQHQYVVFVVSKFIN